MATLIAIFGYRSCVSGEFVCTVAKFPDISHIMGVAPLNKLYSIMFTVYSFSIQAQVRAYDQKLSGFVNPMIRNVLLLAALTSFIFGPCIGIWDCYYDMDIHMWVTTLFVGGEAVYLYILVAILHFNRSQFAPSASTIIDSCILAMCLVAVVRYFMDEGVPGVATDQIGEWIAFYSDFFVRFQLSRIMKFNSELKRLD